MAEQLGFRYVWTSQATRLMPSRFVTPCGKSLDSGVKDRSHCPRQTSVCYGLIVLSLVDIRIKKVSAF